MASGASVVPGGGGTSSASGVHSVAQGAGGGAVVDAAGSSSQPPRRTLSLIGRNGVRVRDMPEFTATQGVPDVPMPTAGDGDVGMGTPVRATRGRARESVSSDRRDRGRRAVSGTGVALNLSQQ